MAPPVQYSCLENPMDGGAWWAAVHGVARSQTWLSNFTFTFHFPLSCIGEGNGNPLQCSCLENLRDRGAWWPAVSGVTQSKTRLKQLSSISSSSRQKLTEFSQENTLVTANALFQQHRRRLYTWTASDGQQWCQINYTLCSQTWRSSIQSAKIRLGADCGSDNERLIAKLRLKLKKVGKPTRPFRYDLNQIT